MKTELWFALERRIYFGKFPWASILNQKKNGSPNNFEEKHTSSKSCRKRISLKPFRVFRCKCLVVYTDKFYLIFLDKSPWLLKKCRVVYQYQEKYIVYYLSSKKCKIPWQFIVTLEVYSLEIENLPASLVIQRDSIYEKYLPLYPNMSQDLLWVLYFYFKYDFRRNLEHFGFSTVGLKNQRQNIKRTSLSFPTKRLTNLLKKYIILKTKHK